MPQPPEGFRAALESAFRDAGRPKPALIALEPIAGGSINQTFLLRAATGVFFCKWNAAAPAPMFRQEASGLAALQAAGSSLHIPRAIALWPDTVAEDTAAAESGVTGPAILVLEYLEPDADGPSPKTWERFGRGLAELHRGSEDRFGWAQDNYCGLTLQENGWESDWPAFYARKRIAPLVDRLAGKGALAAADRAVYDSLLEKLPDLLAHRPVPSLIHGDLWSGNFLAAALGPALVDPAAYCADREAEWGMMSLFGNFPETVLDAYQESWPLPEGWRERQPLYQLYHVLNHFLLFGGSYGAQAIGIARKFT